MASLDNQERSKLIMLTKMLTLKIAQIVVQSRRGKKITHENNKCNNSSPVSSPNSLFSLSIPDEPAVDSDTNNILNGEISQALQNIFCIEISLKTSDGDEMVLELWTVKMFPVTEQSSVSSVYYRMNIMLKSILSISRITPGYKMSRAQYKESYKIYHKIYGGSPTLNELGEDPKTIKISELRTPIGTLLIEVVYRTKLTILPEEKHRTEVEHKNSSGMVQNEHFPLEHTRSQNDKKEIDLTKPLTLGAFVDHKKIQELHDALQQQLPPEPPMSWLLPMNQEIKNMNLEPKTGAINIVKPGGSSNVVSFSAPTASKAIEVPSSKRNGDKYAMSLMSFPFADGSPISELASFYQECLAARSRSDEWTNDDSANASDDSQSLSQQLKMYEDAVPEFDNMVASMFSENGSDT